MRPAWFIDRFLRFRASDLGHRSRSIYSRIMKIKHFRNSGRWCVSLIEFSSGKPILSWVFEMDRITRCFVTWKIVDYINHGSKIKLLLHNIYSYPIGSLSSQYLTRRSCHESWLRRNQRSSFAWAMRSLSATTYYVFLGAHVIVCLWYSF